MNASSNVKSKLLASLEKLAVHDHLCLIYETREEQFAAAIPFMRIGLERGDKCIYFNDENSSDQVLEAMRSEGIDVDLYIESGNLAVVTKKDTYLKEGYFDPDLMITFLKESVRAAKTAGFTALRVTGEMTWALGDDPGTEKLIEYEAKLNRFFAKNKCLAICQYNRKRFSSEIIRDIIYTHPLVIYGLIVCRNFYYVPADEFLEEKQEGKEIERMLGNILEREAIQIQLVEHRDNLEKKVAKRTAALKTLNEKLKAEITRHKQAEEKIKHLNLILQAIRGVNQLITREKDRDRLLKGACEKLVETRGYYNAWIVLTDASGELVTFTETGPDKKFLKKSNLLKSGQLPGCVRKAILQPELLIIKNPANTCTDCPVSGMYGPRDVLIKRLEYGGTIYGAAIASIPVNLIESKDEQELFGEVTGDIAFALHNIELEEQRKRAELAAQEAREYAENIVDTLHEPLVVLDEELRVVSANRFFYQSFKTTPGETEGRLIYELVDRRWDIPGLRELLQEILPKNTFFEGFKVELDFPTAGRRIMLLNARRIYRAANKTQLILLAMEDITERLQAEKVLIESEKRYRELYDNAPIGYHEIDREGRIAGINRTEANLLGYAPEEMIGRYVWEFMAEDQHELSKKAFKKKIEKKKVPMEAFERKYVCKDGKQMDLYISDRLILDKDGKVTGIRSTVQDITERKKAEDALRESEERYRSVSQAAEEAIITADSSGKIDTWNHGAQKIFGYEEGEVLGKPLSILMPKRYRDAYKKGMQRLISTGDSNILGKTVELHGLRKNGVEFPLELSLSSWKTAEKINFTGIIRDITERKNMEQMLIQAEKMASIGQLAAGIAHEINNPIGFIGSNLNTLERYSKKLTEYIHKSQNLAKAGAEKESFDPKSFIDDFNLLSKKYKIEHILENFKDAVAESLEGTARVKKIVSDLRDFSRTDKAEFESADINDVLEKTLSLVWNELKYKAEVVKELGSLPQIECNPGRLTQVFVNLLVNAVHAIEQHGVIRIKTFKVRNSIKVQISDTGKGIPKAQLGKVFDAFFTTKEPGKGTGLGLSISYNIIRDHHGTIEVESKEGSGATFTVTLPLTKADKVVKLKVIVVDDDADIRKLLSEMISGLYPFSSVRTAENAFDAGNLMNLFEPDLILLDITMPGISGLEMCEKIKTSMEHSGIKIILITGLKDDDLQEKAFAAGADAFLRKPISEQKLTQTIQKVMEGRL